VPGRKFIVLVIPAIVPAKNMQDKNFLLFAANISVAVALAAVTLSLASAATATASATQLPA